MQKTASLVVLMVAMTATLWAGPPATAAESGSEPLGLFSAATDIGRPAKPGGANYDEALDEYVVQGSGANMWLDADQFHFVWRRMSGDFILRARAGFDGEGVNEHRKMGWIVRSSLDPDSAYADVAVHGDGLTALQFRRANGGQTEEVRFSATHPDVLQLSRQSGTYTLSVARFGDSFERQRVTDLDLGDEVYVGLFVCSHDEAVIETARFRNVRIVAPAPADLVPYQEYIGSNLEILDVDSGYRRIVHTASDSFQAPNWTPDGQALIYNRNGRLYRFDLDSESAVVIDTGFADQNNNDHVLSFDGERLGISHHPAEQEYQSIVYTLPVKGGTPRQVTPTGPSYLHGWSPDGVYLIYTAERDGDFDIYRIPAAGGDEVRLTRSPGLDDGSEYSPDGRFIYFNSVRSGSMELWRMQPDGGEPEQLTDDGLNNWFPHVSPDGRWLAFLSYQGRRRPRRPPVLQRGLSTADARRRWRAESDRLSLWRPGHHQRAVLVAGRPAPGFRQQHGPVLVPPPCLMADGQEAQRSRSPE